ncbi:hypothetical protein VE02_03831 [Pseudogymnoascus sp. 03VT05]|nr:hypothetical protein VE02_03831 [Pseudogymnoascus sp. 03VT05]
MELMMSYFLRMNSHSSLQCSFYLVPSGELTLEDATTGHHTYIDWHDQYGKQVKYALQGDPRGRIIPQAGESVQIGIVFGQEISFQFKWRVSSASETAKMKLALIPQATIASNQGMTLVVPRDRNLDPTAYEARTVNTPNVPMEYTNKPLRQIHPYGKIGSGGFGNVFKAVDLRTGCIWAVKECINPKKEVLGENWKLAFKQEVEALAQLSHRNIIRLEHHQGWSLGRSVQIFFQLCEGSVHDLLPEDHQCFQNTAPESWVPSFISQTLDGLAFIHKHGMVHRDIKPENILYDNGRQHGSMTFYISDFGLTVPKQLVRGVAGTI